ncbi:general odorant-binding protein 57b-like [Drosophila eugracilis]|uniref:general odorant-binding protein 57b-like n=1 Tax=Drosophila eugracilis TaxID=29029 RepID=UPI0007E7AE4E|nr:general odorant-binding protein 57b-like [Drosophila eugracilis]
MFTYRLVFVGPLILVLISSAKARHPFDIFHWNSKDFDECLDFNNISIAEYEKYARFETLDYLLNEKVNFNYKCNIKCQLERDSTKWLNDQGRMDLQLMNTSKVASESITKCMDQASEEPCAYSFKLVICAFKAGHPTTDSE